MLAGSQVLLNKGQDRLQSAKAGAVAGLGGTLGFLPFAFVGGGNPWLQVASVLVSTALFGIVLR